MPTPRVRTAAQLLVVLPVLLLGVLEPYAAPNPTPAAPSEPLPPNAVARIGTTLLRHGSQVASVAFSPYGTKVISTDGFSVGVWDVRTGRELAFRMLREQYGCWPRLSPDGSLIACRVGNGALGVQEVETGKVRSRFPSGDGGVHNLVFSRDNLWLTSTDDEGIVSLWDVGAGKLAWSKQSPTKGYPSGQAFTPDGKGLVHAANDGQLVLYSVQTGKELWHTAAHQNEDMYYFTGLDISPDGAVVAVLYRWRDVELREVKTGKLLRAFEATGSWHGPRFTPDGKQLLCSAYRNSGAVLFWDVATGKLARELPGDPRAEPYDFAVSADGKFLVVGGWDHAVHLWDLTTEKELFPRGHPGGEVFAQLLADGKTVLTTCRYWTQRQYDRLDKHLGFWDLRGKSLKQTTFDAKEAHAFAISPDATVVATAVGTSFGRFRRPIPNGGLRSSLHITERATGQELARTDGLNFELHEMAFSPDGRFLFTSVDNPGPNPDDYHRRRVVVVWKRTATGLEKTAEIDSIRAWSCRFVCAPDSRWVGVDTGEGYDFHDCETGKLIGRCRPLAGAVRAVSPSGRVLACTNDAERTAFLVERATGKTVCKLECAPRYLVRPRFAFSPDGRIVASDLNSDAITLWDVFTGKPVGKLEGHRGDIESLCFTPDGRFLVSGSADTTALIWDYRKVLPGSAGEPEKLSDKRLDELWVDLQSADAERGYRAVSALVRAPERAVPFLRKQVSAATADERQIRTWIAVVGRGDEALRARALAELSKLGALAAPAIQEALRTESLETKQRLEKLLGAPGAPPAPLWLATQRALETLELIGTPEARAVLEELSQGPADSPRTEEARRALERLRKREALVRGPTQEGLHVRRQRQRGLRAPGRLCRSQRHAP
jgi:WD40 repeat protein